MAEVVMEPLSEDELEDVAGGQASCGDGCGDGGCDDPPSEPISCRTGAAAD